MFYLGGSDFPTTRASLAAAITDGLRQAFELPTAGTAVKVEGGELPAVQKMTVDLTNARAKLDRLPPPPKGVEKMQLALVAGTFELAAHPLRIESAGVDLSLTASEARFDYDRNSDGQPLLLPTAAKDGHVRIAVRKNELDAILLAGAKNAAGKHGVQVQDTQLQLTQIDPKTVALEARVKAKKMFVSAVVTVRGRLSIDDNLNATLSGLSCTGEGMMGTMASNLIQPQLDKYNDRLFPLTAFELGSLRLRDLQIKVDDSLTVTAAFGS